MLRECSSFSTMNDPTVKNLPVDLCKHSNAQRILRYGSPSDAPVTTTPAVAIIEQQDTMEVPESSETSEFCSPTPKTAHFTSRAVQSLNHNCLHFLLSGMGKFYSWLGKRREKKPAIRQLLTLAVQKLMSSCLLFNPEQTSQISLQDASR
jgi:hypothetical protein